MYLFGFNLRPIVKLAWLGLVGALSVGQAVAQPRQKIEFSDPGSPVVVSNLNRLDTHNSSAKQMQEQLFKSIGTVQSKGPLDMPGAFTFPLPQGPMIILDKKAKELREQQKNWAFIGLTDLSPSQSLEDMMHVKQYGPDGKEKEAMSPVEKYLATEYPKKSSLDPMRLGENFGQLPDFSGTNGVSRSSFLGGGINQEVLENSMFKPASATSGGSGQPKALGGSPVSASRQEEYAKQHREDFLKILNGSSMSTAISASGSFVGGQPQSSSTTPVNLSTFAPSAPPATLRNSLDVLPNYSSAAVFHSHLLDDPNARALGLPDPSTLKPVVAAAAPPPPPILPSSAFPHRKF